MSRLRAHVHDPEDLDFPEHVEQHLIDSHGEIPADLAGVELPDLLEAHAFWHDDVEKHDDDDIEVDQ